MAMTIDIYNSKQLAYNQRRAIRQVQTPPTVRGLTIKQFNHGNGADSSVILDKAGGVSPRLITYVIVREDGAEPLHFYVIGFEFVSQQRYRLNLLLNAWAGINRDKPAFITRSNYLPSSAIMKKRESKLNFNQVKAQEILVQDQYGNEPWGILYLNRTESPLSVELSDLNYNIVGTEIPVSPDAPQQQGDGSQLAFYNDYTVTGTPAAPTSINAGVTYLYRQETLDLSNIIELPSLNNRASNPINTVGTATKKVASVYYLWQEGGNFGFFSIGVGTGTQTITVDQSGKITAASGNAQVYQASTAVSSSRQAVWDIVRNEYSGTTSPNGNDYIFCANYVHSGKPSLSSNMTTALQSLVGCQILGGGSQGTQAVSDVSGRTIAPLLQNGIFRDSANMFDFTFTNIQQQGGSGTFVSYSGDNDTLRTARPTSDETWLAEGTNPRAILTHSTAADKTSSNYTAELTFSFTTTFTAQESVRGQQRYNYTTIRSRYTSATITAANINVINFSNDTIYQNQQLTRGFVDINLPSDAIAWFMASGTSFANPGIKMPTVGNFQTEGLAQEFVFNNARYVYSPLRDLSGFYKVGQKVYQVAQSQNTVSAIAQLSYTINTPSSNTNTFGFIGGQTTGTGNAPANIQVTHLGEPQLVDTVIDFVLDNEVINRSTIISEPYAILAIPLFELNYRTTQGGALIKSQMLNTQKVFYDFIRSYSGTGQVADAQIIPYAPEVFKNGYRKDADGLWLDMSQMNTVGAQSTGAAPTSIPFVVLDNSNINFSFYTNLNPYSHPRKESTLRKMRLVSPNLDSIFEWNYFDFNNEVTDWGSQHNNADTRIDVQITLKPFATFMHASPYVRDNSLMGRTNFRDLRGLVCGSSIWQSTMTSSAFETFRRQNTMYEQIQQRKVGTLALEHQVEKQNDVVSSIVGTLQGTYYGAMAGSQAGGVWEDIFGGAGGVAGGVAGGAAAGIAYGVQNAANERLRQREAGDLKFYYEANIANIKAQPDTLNRVSSFNQAVLRRFSIVLEVYATTVEEANYYDQYIDTFAYEINIMDNLQNHLITPCYVEGFLPFSDEPPHIHQRLNEDLQKGVYYYESV